MLSLAMFGSDAKLAMFGIDATLAMLRSDGQVFDINLLFFFFMGMSSHVQLRIVSLSFKFSYVHYAYLNGLVGAHH